MYYFIFYFIISHMLLDLSVHVYMNHIQLSEIIGEKRVIHIRTCIRTYSTLQNANSPYLHGIIE